MGRSRCFGCGFRRGAGSWWSPDLGFESGPESSATARPNSPIATSELAHRNIRNVQIDQGPIHRLMQCGTLRLSSAGQSGIELTMRDLDDPEAVRDLIYQQHG
ncbi:PH domain-containing protein [Salinibacter ruber]|uniref:PH domain-containing protein n=1 Tax=Salinibacter ruber TaxID=146919 RepID=UPI00216A6B49